MADSAQIIGQGANLVMDQIYRALIGDAGANLRAGKPVSGADVANSALTVGLNALPVGGAGAAAKGAGAIDNVAASAAIKKILQNPEISIVAPRQAMPEILSSRFKGQRELMAEQPNFDPTQFGRRETVEDILLGYPLSTPDKFRPVYGAVANKTELPQWLLEKTPGKLGDALRLFDPRTNTSGVFGNMDSVISRVPASAVDGTFTIGDSFAPFLNEAINLRAIDSPQVREQILKGIATGRVQNQKLPYIEAQMSPARNPVDAIRRIDIPPSYKEVWTAASLATPPKFTVGGARVLDPVVKQVPKTVKEMAKYPGSRTLKFQDELYNNPVRPSIPQKRLPDLLGVEKQAVKGAKGKAF
jgi:hypothetical protein